MKRPAWYTSAIIYALDIKVFKDSTGDGIGDIRGVISELDYLQKLGINCLWLLPFYDSTDLDNGYDVVNHYQIDHRLGNFEDFHELVREAKKRDIQIIIDFVYHHTSHEHPWFQVGRIDPDSPYRNYYIWTDSLPDPELNNPTNKPAMLGEQHTVWTYDRVANAYYYHRFYEYEPDLNIANPNVQEELFAIMKFWLSFGIAGFRVDAATMAFEKKGIDGTQMKNPTDFIEKMRKLVKQKVPDGILWAEADVKDGQFNQFVKNGTRFNLLYNFYLNANLYVSLVEKNGQAISRRLTKQLTLPRDCEWVNFIRNLDELNLEKLPSITRNKVMDVLAPSQDMRAYQRGIRRRIAPMLDGDLAKLKLAYSILFSLPGAVMIPYGDEIGMGENLALPFRNAVRTPMQWNSNPQAGFSLANHRKMYRSVIDHGKFSYKKVNALQAQQDPNSLWNCIRKLIELRKSYDGLFLQENCQLIKTSHKALFGIQYQNQLTQVVMYHNLSDQTVKLPKSYPSDQWQVQFVSSTQFSLGKKAMLEPLGFCWLEKRENQQTNGQNHA